MTKPFTIKHSPCLLKKTDRFNVLFKARAIVADFKKVIRFFGYLTLNLG